MARDVASMIRSSISKDEMIEHALMVRMSRSDAGNSAKSLGLTGSRAARVTGYAAHELAEHRLAELADRLGGLLINGDHFPGTELRSYQPVAQYGTVLLGKATIADRRELPRKNITRENGVSLNRPYTLKPELPGLEVGADPKNALYALLLTCRDHHDSAKLFEVAIGVIESDFSGFIYYEEIDQFIAGYSDEEVEAERTVPAPAADGSIVLELRKDVLTFVPPEKPLADVAENPDSA